MLRPRSIPPVPEETARIAQAAFPKGNRYLTLRDELGTIFNDEMFAHLFPKVGQPGEAPWRLALVTIVQHAEGLSDREAADAVRARIDLKYLLGLELDDPGFHYSILSRFRDRLIEGKAEHLLLDALVETSRKAGLIRERGKARTDSTHVLTNVRALSRVELVGETMRAALNAVAEAEPEWLKAFAPDDWYKRYANRFSDGPKPRKRRQKGRIEQIGKDGLVLLETVYKNDSPPQLCNLNAVEFLRRCWIEQFYVQEGEVQVRESGNLPPSPNSLQTPHDADARYGTKGGPAWVGYKTHFTETCDEDSPSLITVVTTTAPATSDVSQTPGVHAALASKGILPIEHFVDNGFTSADLVVESRKTYGLKLIGPMKPNNHWQQEEGHFDVSSFAIDWNDEVATCPQDKKSVGWKPTFWEGYDTIRITFSQRDCGSCEMRAKCVRSSGKRPRRLIVRPKEQYEVLQEIRSQQKTPEWRAYYARRAGIEGTFSQGVRAMSLRQSRYRGAKKGQLQNVAIASGINIQRLTDWFHELPRAKTRISRFAAIRA